MTRKNKETEEVSKSRKRARVEKRKSTPQEEPDKESDISDTDKFSDDEEGGIRIDDIYIPPAPPPVCSYESIGPRLIITHIVNENFKSYAGRVVVGPFDKSFSSIVGPNGSGKSNVIDSMLFVFGYRATKIRSKKVSVLIHKSEQFQNVTSCKVEVHFAQIFDKENGEYDKIPGSEFVISRTAFQNSSSFYELNHKKVHFKEVAMTLRKHGIDLIHNRFLILQGEVEQIALMKPKAQNPHETGMLEYLEDIIGTTRYKEPIEKLQARIQQLNEERQEKLNRLKVVQSERDALRGPMEETVNFLKTENRITQLKNKKFQLQLFKINRSISETETERAKVEKTLEELKTKLTVIKEQRGEERSEMESLKKIVNQMTKKYEDMVQINKNAENKNTALREEYKQLKKTKKKTADTLASEEDKLQTILKIPEENRAQIEKLSEEEKKLDAKREKEEAAFQQVMSGLQKETKTFQDEKDKLQTEQIKLKKTYDELRSAYELAKSERDIYLSNEQNEKTKLAELENALQKVQETLKARKGELVKFQHELPKKEADVKEAEKQAQAAKNEETEIVSQLRIYQSQLEEKTCSMSANRSRSRVLDYLMKQKMEGRIPGILGRLGDLGAIDEKYDVAISTAASGSLDYVLVEHNDSIRPCIEALKRDDVGRSTFIALNKVAGSYRNKTFKAPENVPRLFDLVRVQDERLLPAFYYILRDTLVAKDLEQATRIAYGATRHRVVTLNGELIEATGTMSGGGRQVMRGKMGSSVTVNTDANAGEEITRLERKVNALKEQLETVRQKERDAGDVITRSAPDISVMKMNVTRFSIEIEGLTKQEPELKKQIVNQKQKVKEATPNDKKVKELESNVVSTEKGAKKAEVEVNAIQEKVNAVHEKIMEITGGKTNEAQKKLDEITKQWEKTRSTITQLQVAIKTSERNAKKSQEKINNMKAELEEAEKREKEIKEEKETLDNDYRLSEERVQQLEEEISEKKSRLEGLQEENKKFMQQVNEIEATKVKEEQNLEAIEKKINDTKRDVPVIRSKLEKLTLHKIPVFREPDDDQEQEENSTERENNAEAAPREAPNANADTELIRYEDKSLEENSVTDINTLLQKEDEYLKTLTPNLNTLKDYERMTLQYIERTNELKEITERRNLCRQGYEEARKNRLQEFMTSFTIISNKLKELYQMLTMGGDAELDLHDSLDPFTEGINFCVRPPKKSWKNITNLSGGEKTLSSLALVFALHYYRPTPLYVMDEIDAALDFKNVSIVGYYIKERTKNAQFIVISLRTNMFELANALTGIYKTYNCTKTVTVRPGDLGKKSGPAPPADTNKHPQEPVTRVNTNNEERKRKVNKRLSNIGMSPTQSDEIRTSKPTERGQKPSPSLETGQKGGRGRRTRSSTVTVAAEANNLDGSGEFKETDMSAIDEDSDQSGFLRRYNERHDQSKNPEQRRENDRTGNKETGANGLENSVTSGGSGEGVTERDMSAIDEDSDDSFYLRRANEQQHRRRDSYGKASKTKETLVESDKENENTTNVEYEEGDVGSLSETSLVE